MSTYFNALDTSEGVVHVLTKTRWMGFVPLPHTSVMPRSGAELKRLGTLIKWTTKDAATLATLHKSIISLVEQFGISGIREIADSARMTDRVAKTFGGRWQDVVKEAGREGVAFPVPDEVLGYIKGFM